MSRQVTFNGATLIRPGAATRVDVSKFNVAALTGVGYVAIVGNADGGQPRVIKEWLSATSVRNFYRSGDLVDAANILQSPSADPLIQGGALRIFTYKVNNSTQSSLTIQGASAAQPASHQSSNAGPYWIRPGDEFNYETDTSGGPQTLTFAGTASVKTAAGAPVGLPMANETLVLQMNGSTQLITIQFATEGTLAAVITSINAQLGEGYAQDNGGSLELVSTQYGTGSLVTVDASSTGLTKLNITAGAGSSGTGDAVDLANMTEAELKTKLDGSGHMVLDITTAPPTLKSVTVGAAGQLIISASNPTTLNTNLGFTPATYNGSAAGAPVDTITFTSVDYGTHTNTISLTLVDPAPTSNTRQVTFTRTLDGNTTTNTSGTLGGTAKFTILYNGAAASSTMTITSTQLTTSCAAVPADDLSLAFTDYTTLDDLISAINAHGGGGIYTAVALVTDSSTFDPADLDWVTAVDIKTGTYSAYAVVFDIVDWVNTNVEYVTATREATGDSVPTAFSTAKYLTGGTLGTSANADWVTAFDALKTVRVDHVVPLCSADATAAQGTYTFASVAATAALHAKDMSATAGRSERQAWIGYDATAANLITQANTLNSEHVCLTADKLVLPKGRSGTVSTLETWSSAVALAGMRSAAELGLPLTKKFVQTFGLERSWDPDTSGEIESLLLNGVIPILKDPRTNAYRVEKCITTWTKGNNNALEEESIVNVWKTVAYQLRVAMEDRFIGQKGTLARVNEMEAYATEILNQFGPRERGGVDALVDGVDDNGNLVEAFRDLNITIGANGNPSDVATLDVTIQIVSGINFILNSIFAVPASLSAAV